MKHFGWRWVAASSLLFLALAASAETRPRYGGTLHVAVRAAPTSLDPAEQAQPDSFAQRSITLLIFDTLVTSDENLRVQPSLATSWQASAGNQRWQIRLRRGVKFHDAAPFTAEIAAASLRTANPSWNVVADGDSVIIELSGSDPDLLAELALPRNAIVSRNSDGKLSGTGPFQIVDWQPGRKLTLAADEDCWRGRPFLDGIEIEMGKSFRDQMTAVELGKSELVEVAPEQAHRVSLERLRMANSSPMELVALFFNREAASPDEKALREALAWSMERASMHSVLLQGAGQPTAAILPNWMSGYAFVFPDEVNLPRAREEREQVRTVPNWTIGYDPGDPLARVLAERVALNAKDAGLTLQPISSATADLRLWRVPLSSSDPWIALSDVAATAGLPGMKTQGSSAEDLHAAEQAVLATERVIPLFHLPVSYAGSFALRNWTVQSDGKLGLADAWLESRKP